TRNKTEKLAPKSVFSIFRKHRFLSDLRSLFLESGAAAPARYIRTKPLDAGARHLVTCTKAAPLKNKKKELSPGCAPSINMPPLAGFRPKAAADVRRLRFQCPKGLKPPYVGCYEMFKRACTLATLILLCGTLSGLANPAAATLADAASAADYEEPKLLTGTIYEKALEPERVLFKFRRTTSRSDG